MKIEPKLSNQHARLFKKPEKLIEPCMPTMRSHTILIAKENDEIVSPSIRPGSCP